MGSYPPDDLTDRQDWRLSLKKGKSSPVDFKQLNSTRQEAVDALRSDLFSFKGVSLAFLNKFWRDVRRGERYPSVELYTLNDDAHDLPAGTTVKRVESEAIDGESVHLRCYYPPKGKFYTFWATQLQWKDRKFWTVDDLCQFGLIPDADLTKEPYIGRLDSGMVGSDFEGRVVIYPRKARFEHLLISIRDFVGDLGTIPAEASYFWLDMFSTNIATIERCKVQDGDQEDEQFIEFFRMLKDLKKTTLNLFDQRFIYFDCWDNPLVLQEAWSVWELSEIFERGLSFEVLTEKQTASDFVTVYDSEEDGVFEKIDYLDPTMLKCENATDKKHLITSLTAKPQGFLSVRKLLHKTFSEWFVKEVEDDVKNFPEANDHIGMERFAIFLYKTGNYMRKHEKDEVALSYFKKSIDLYGDLQEYNREGFTKNPSNEITMQEQLEIDRINGGACKTHLYIAQLHLKESQFQLAQKEIKCAEAEATKIRTSKHAFFLDIYEVKALMCTKQTKIERAITEYTAMEYIFIDEPSSDPKRYARTEYELAMKYKDVKKFNEALASLRRAKTLLDKSLGTDNPIYGKVLVAEAVILSRQGHQNEALQLFETGLNILSVSRGTMNLDIAKLYGYMGQTYASLGGKNYGSALNYYRLAIETFRYAAGPFSKGLADALNAEGLILKGQKKYEPAEKAFEQSIDALVGERSRLEDEGISMSRTELDKWKGMLAKIYSNLGQTYEVNDKVGMAVQAFRKSYEFTRDILGADAEKTKLRYQRWQKLL